MSKNKFFIIPAIIFSAVSLTLFSCSGNETPSSSAVIPESSAEASGISEYSESTPYVEQNSEITDGHYLSVNLTEPYSFNIEFDSNREFNTVVLNGISENVVSIEIAVKNTEGEFEKVYFQSEISQDRICYIGNQSSDAVSIRFVSSGGDIALGEIYTETTDFSNLSLSSYVTVTPSEISKRKDDFSLLSDAVLISGSAKWDKNGEIVPGENLSKAINKIPSNQCKIWISLSPQSVLIKNKTAGKTIDSKEKINVLTENILDFIDSCGGRDNIGIDFDWEFPYDEEWPFFSNLIVSLKSAAPGLTVSAAFYPENISLTDDAVAALDRINVMAYDLFDENGYQSTYLAAQRSIDYFLALGFSPKQLFLGIPLYGRPVDQTQIWKLYKDTPDGFSDDTNLFENAYYNGALLIGDKLALANSKNLGGITFFHLFCDFPSSNQRSLIMHAYGILK